MFYDVENRASDVEESIRGTQKEIALIPQTQHQSPLFLGYVLVLDLSYRTSARFELRRASAAGRNAPRFN